ncbi:MAG: hypothetical protein OK422_00100 [Thaumarchaeota archaeon]|nr:hypothetical protein [Nitrososphaerota archaeon]
MAKKEGWRGKPQPEMRCKDKLAEVAYFRHELNGHSDNLNEVGYYLDAFLSASYSVMELMLYDFAESRDIGFTRDEELWPRDLEVASRIGEKQIGLAFVKWWHTKIANLNSNPLWPRRQKVIRRGKLSPGSSFSFTVSGWSPSLSSVIVGGVILAGSIPVKGHSVIVAAGRPPPQLADTEHIFLQDTPDEDIRKQCAELFLRLSEIVEEAEKKFLMTQ